MDHKNAVICNLPSSGLGNKLLVWGRATAFARINNYSLLVSPWYQISIGPLIRRERQTRFYLTQIKSQGLLDQIRRVILLRHGDLVEEPSIEVVNGTYDNQKAIYVFRKSPHWSDYFNGIKNYRDLLYKELLEIVPGQHLRKVEALERPVISLHIRCGDFRELKPGEDFARVGLVRTPLNYFIDMVQKIRSIVGLNVPITVFSDGHPEELAPILRLPGLRFSIENEPIVDMLLMAKSKVIVFSAGSTFSQWSGFLSNAAIIHHPQHFHSSIRSESVNLQYFEGVLPDSLDEYPELFVQHLKRMAKPLSP